MQDNRLTEEECRMVARKIDAVVLNTKYPGEDDMGRFALLMYELHQKKFNLPWIDIKKDFAPYCERPFPDNVIKDMQECRDVIQELILAMHDREERGIGLYLSEL